jgi:ribosomal protein L37AE/L43A
MKIIFDRSQVMLKKIVALKEAQQEFSVVCPECKCEINSEDVGDETLACQKCGYFAKLEDSPLSKREQVWEQFNSLQGKK